MVLDCFNRVFECSISISILQIFNGRAQPVGLGPAWPALGYAPGYMSGEALKREKFNPSFLQMCYNNDYGEPKGIKLISSQNL